MCVETTYVWRTPLFRPFVLAALALGLVLPASPMRAAEDAEPEFSETFMTDQENIQLGRELFQQQCSRCHGKGSYPGKAPKLKPQRSSPEEIYAKVTYGFGKMPAWEDTFSNHERAAITAYMKSPIFTN